MNGGSEWGEVEGPALDQLSSMDVVMDLDEPSAAGGGWFHLAVARTLLTPSSEHVE
ncbi:MAG: hypothetical protein RLO52_26435 [Sandaracinaceae bacterium]